jgi:hypothetical protein
MQPAQLKDIYKVTFMAAEIFCILSDVWHITLKLCGWL